MDKKVEGYKSETKLGDIHLTFFSFRYQAATGLDDNLHSIASQAATSIPLLF